MKVVARPNQQTPQGRETYAHPSAKNAMKPRAPRRQWLCLFSAVLAPLAFLAQRSRGSPIVNP